MIDACKFDDKECPNRPTHHYVWEWGEEGLCCDDHKAVLETRSGQLSRSIRFSSLGRAAARASAYTTPQLQQFPPDIGALKMKLAEEAEHRKAVETQVGKLEQERELTKEKMREQELRIQDLLKQNGELKSAVANAELQAAAAVELSNREVIEGAADESPTTLSPGSKGKRSR